jgi:N-acetyl-gamma-glutamyl-phosphate reductase common form
VIKAGLYGGRGYVARELVRLLSVHGGVEIAWWYSREAGRVEEAHRSLLGSGMEFTSEESLADVDVVFFATPVGVAQEKAKGFLERGAKVIAMAADFRLRNREDFERIYGKHTCWELVDEAVYGIPELHRERIAKARIVATPGCFATAAILALAPIVRQSGIDLRHIVVDGVTGTSGAGAALDRSVHHAEMCQTVIPYNVVDHRHTYEMEAELSRAAGRDVMVHFTSEMGPFSRGILATCHLFCEKTPAREEVLRIYEEFYRGEPFVSVNRIAKDPKARWDYIGYPSVADVAGSNYCQIGADVDRKRGRIVIFAALDNMGKGACGAAVQSMNLMFGLAETTGISQRGLGV